MEPSDILQKHNVKKTWPRVAIIKALQSSSLALSECDIKQFMGNMYDRVTFYRNMQVLADAGILHRIVVNNTLVKYALNKQVINQNLHNSHAHFYCRVCNGVICLGNFNINQSLPQGCIAENFELLISGVCSKCKSNA